MVVNIYGCTSILKVFCKSIQTLQTKGHFKLSKIAMDRLELIEDGKIAFTYITKKDEELAEAKNGDQSVFLLHLLLFV